MLGKNSAEMERNQTEHRHGTEGSDSREIVRCNILLTLLSANNVVTFVQIEVETYYVLKMEFTAHHNLCTSAILKNGTSFLALYIQKLKPVV